MTATPFDLEDSIRAQPDAGERLPPRARIQSLEDRIPTVLNMTLCGGLIVAMPGLLWAACNLASAPLRWGSVALFALLGHTLFAMIHEAEHSKLHPHKATNETLGVVLSVFFPASFTILRLSHLTHHATNRTEREFLEFYRPGQNRWVNALKYYAAPTGAIWIGAVLLSVALCFVPRRFFSPQTEQESEVATLRSALSFLSNTRPSRVRLEVAFTVAMWIAMFWLLNLNIMVLWAYLLYGFVWSTQQYIYHVRTPVHVIEGSWNLHVWPIFGLVFLNLNYHLTHHRHPRVPWIWMPHIAEEKPWRSYLVTWARCFLPPRPVKLAWPKKLVKSGPLPEGAPIEFVRPGTMRPYGGKALITGASSGIGAAFARELSGQGYELILVARREDRLRKLQHELPTSAEVVVADLATPEGRERVALAAGDSVGVMVHSAGYGVFGAFEQEDLQRQIDMVQVNATAAVDLCHRVIPGMRKRGAGGIILVSSISAFQATPWLAAYGATKTFVLSLAEALSLELKQTGVDVLGLCPGPTRTEFKDTAGVDADVKDSMWSTPEDVVKTAMASLGRRPSVVVGTANKLSAVLPRLVPRITAARISGLIMRKLSPKLKELNSRQP